MEKTKAFDFSGPSLLPYSPIVLLRDILKRWLIILMAAVVVGVGDYILMDQTYQPIYRTDATLVITTQDSTSTVYSNLNSTSELAAVFTSLLNSSVMQKTVLEELEMTTWDCTISAAQIEETNLLTLSVSSSDPRTAFLVIQSLIEHHEIVTYNVVGDMVIEVLELPEVPTMPSNLTDMQRHVMIAMMVAAFLSVAVLFIFSYLRDTVRSHREAEKKLNCWCLGEIHHEKKRKTFLNWLRRRKRGLTITNPESSFHFLETFRKLRRRIEQYTAQEKVVMVTSVMENEGKSTVAVNLALSLAQKHKRVLLIDLDLRKPACQKILEQRNCTYSTRDVITGKAELMQAVVVDPLSGLELLLERPVIGEASRPYDTLVGSKGVAAMFRAARENYDYVIVDLPPMSVAVDTEYVMEQADASLLVVRQNQVPAKNLNKAIDALERGKAKLLGCVLNNVYSTTLARSHNSKYGYGYGYYGYGRYGQKAKESDPESEES